MKVLKALHLRIFLSFLGVIGVQCLGSLAYGQATFEYFGGSVTVGPGSSEENQREIANRVSAGYWRITWIEPRISGKVTAKEQSFMRCYSKSDMKRAANIGLPAAQEKQCKTRPMLIGDDVSFKSECPDGDYDLRLFDCRGQLCGKFSYMAAESRLKIDAAIFLDKVAETCPAAQ
ncbi:hypothetical protein [Bartonella sp. LJL80]